MSRPRTISRAETTPQVRAMTEALRDTLSIEQAWAVAKDYLDQAYSDGYDEGYRVGSRPGASGK